MVPLDVVTPPHSVAEKLEVVEIMVAPEVIIIVVVLGQFTMVETEARTAAEAVVF
jgi:hypothetical protein